MDGMRIFVHTDHFKDLNLGFALDEGIGNDVIVLIITILIKDLLWICSGFALDEGIGEACHHHCHCPHHHHHLDKRWDEAFCSHGSFQTAQPWICSG